MEGFDPKFWLDLVQFALTGVIGIYLWIERRRDKTSDRIEQLEAKHENEIKEIKKSLSEIDARLVKAISHNELEPIHARITNIGEDLKEMSGEFKGVKSQLQQISDFLLNGGRG